MGENLRRNVPQVGYDPTKPPVQYKFPQDEPSFWLPGQNTKYPDIYVEPDSSKMQDKSPLAVPITIRGLVGWNQGYNPGVPFRTIYLGYRDYYNCDVFYVSEETYGLGIYRGTSRRTMVEYKALSITTEISSAYGANQSTTEVLEIYTFLDLHLESITDENGILVGLPIDRRYAGNIQDGNYEYIGAGGVPATMFGKKHRTDIGGFSGADGDIPAGSPYDNVVDAYKYTNQDAEGNEPDTPGYKGNESAHIGPHRDKVMRIPSTHSAEYFFLRNVTAGNGITQISTLVMVVRQPGLTPSSPEWAGMIFEVESGGGTRRFVPGLILAP